MLGRGAVEKFAGKSTHCPRCIGLGLRGGSDFTHIGQYWKVTVMVQYRLLLKQWVPGLFSELKQWVPGLLSELKQWMPGLLSDHFDLVFSEYPTHRSKKDSEGVEMGVAGSVSLLQNVTLSTQPVSSLDWSPDKRGLCICSSFDQTVRVLIVTKLQTIWPSTLNWTFPRGLLTEFELHLAPSFLTEDIGSECWSSREHKANLPSASRAV